LDSWPPAQPQHLQRRANQENQEEHADDRLAFGSSGWRGTARPRQPVSVSTVPE